MRSLLVKSLTSYPLFTLVGILLTVQLLSCTFRPKKGSALLTLGFRRRLSLTALTALLFSLPLAANAQAPDQLPSEIWLMWPASGTISADVAWHFDNEGVLAVDIANNEGTPIAAAHSGTVTYAGTTSTMFFCTFVEPHR